MDVCMGVRGYSRVGQGKIYGHSDAWTKAQSRELADNWKTSIPDKGGLKASGPGCKVSGGERQERADALLLGAERKAVQGSEWRSDLT